MKGESMMVLPPDFSMYAFYASIAEARVVTCPKHADLTIDVDAVIEKAREENVRLILFSNPCNPTSTGLSREDARRLIRSVSALVVLDEAYMDFWDQSLLQEVESYDKPHHPAHLLEGAGRGCAPPRLCRRRAAPDACAARREVAL